MKVSEVEELTRIGLFTSEIFHFQSMNRTSVVYKWTSAFEEETFQWAPSIVLTLNKNKGKIERHLLSNYGVENDQEDRFCCSLI